MRPADVETALVAWLKDTRTPAVRVSTRIPNPRPSSFVRVRRIGGNLANPYQERVLMQIDCWGDTDQVAWDLAADVWQRMDYAIQEQVGVGTWVAQTGLSSPIPNSDPDSGQDRYIITANMVINLEEST